MFQRIAAQQRADAIKKGVDMDSIKPRPVNSRLLDWFNSPITEGLCMILGWLHIIVSLILIASNLIALLTHAHKSMSCPSPSSTLLLSYLIGYIILFAISLACIVIVSSNSSDLYWLRKLIIFSFITVASVLSAISLFYTHFVFWNLSGISFCVESARYTVLQLDIIASVITLTFPLLGIAYGVNVGAFKSNLNPNQFEQVELLPKRTL